MITVNDTDNSIIVFCNTLVHANEVQTYNVHAVYLLTSQDQTFLVHSIAQHCGALCKLGPALAPLSSQRGYL